MLTESLARQRVSTPVFSERPSLNRPPLKWAGGKRWQLPHLLPLWQAHHHRRLVEPFCGGLAVSLGLLPKRALLNDRNPHLINFYQSMQRGFHIRMPMHNSKFLFAAYRNRFNRLIAANKSDSAEAAALFYYLNRTGFNGLCRFNRAGLFNVPFGQHRRINYLRDFSAFQPTLAPWQFVSGDYAALKLEPDDFIYADPPYDVEFTQYSKEAFGWEDQVQVADWLARHPGPVILSNQATDRIVKLYTTFGFTLKFLSAPRRISWNGDRTPAREVLAFKNL